MSLVPRSGLESLMYSTLRIIVEYPDGNSGVGTGFLVLFNHKGTIAPSLVTNRHVLEGASRLGLVAHVGELVNGKNTPSGKSVLLWKDIGPGLVYYHPNEDIDLCALSFAVMQEHAMAQGFLLYAQFIDESWLLEPGDAADLDMMNDVYMVGYPTGIWDQANNFPIFRKGVTATHPAIDFNDRPITVIDMACYPGSSGSPVILDGECVRVLGVLTAGPKWHAPGKVLTPGVPEEDIPPTLTPVMMHLGFVIKARMVLDLGDAIRARFPSRLAQDGKLLRRQPT